MVTDKIGYSFRNYTPPSGEWGEALTADDLRFTYLWGVDLQANDVNKTVVADGQLEWCIEQAVFAWESDIAVDIFRRIYKTDPASSLTQARFWKEGVDYTSEEEWYDFDPARWQNYGFLQLRHKPIISIETAELYDVLGNKIMDVINWVRLYKKPGQIALFPKGTLGGGGYVATGTFSAWPRMFNAFYPQGFKIEYTTGIRNSDFIDEHFPGIRDMIGMYAAIIALAWVGDGLMAGFSSSSVSLDGLSESFSSTQSATSAYFGARIKDYIDRIKEFRKNMKAKHAIAIGFV